MKPSLLLAAGLAAAVLLLFAAWASPDRAAQAWLFAWVFWAGLSLGALALLMLHGVTGGRWGVGMRPALLAASLNWPLMGMMFIPILFVLPRVFPWAIPGYFKPDAYDFDKRHLLNIHFYIVRWFIYFVAWWWLARRGEKLTLAARANREESGLARWGALGLVAHFPLLTFAAVDWIMSLDPHWSSTMFPVILLIGQALGAMALAVAAVLSPMRRADSSNSPPPGTINDFGNMLLAFVMLWAYVSFMQFLIIWNGDLPEDNAWYVLRGRGGWLILPIFLVVFHFAVPFAILLSRTMKRAGAMIFALAGGLLIAHAADTAWLMIPSFSRVGHGVDWRDGLALVAIGGIWLAAWQRRFAPLMEPGPQREAGA